ncbi:Dicarboxylic amino acid permease [Pseudohyphozyma bogoriensis]|nr:Dicarboxylic amino acid permease [Pseudohyphozyma bogoriensis]
MASTSFDALAQRLNHDCLVLIFEFVLLTSPTQLWGSEAVSWPTNEDLAPLALVCRAWSRPANDVLYRSVRIISPHQAKAFHRTIGRVRGLAGCVRDLVVGVPPDREGLQLVVGGEEQDEDDRRTEETMVEIVSKCGSLQKVQLYSFDEPERATLVLRLLGTMAGLRVVVSTPRIQRADEACWTTPMLLDKGLFKSLHYFELVPLIYVSKPPRTTPPLALLPANTTTPRQPQLALKPALTTLKLHHLSASLDPLSSILRSCPNLTTLDIYHERFFPLDDLRSSLSALKSLSTLSYLSNPPAQDLDLDTSLTTITTQRKLFTSSLLSSFPDLHTLVLSNNDFPASILSLLPPLVTTFEIATYDEGIDDYLPEMVKDMADGKVPRRLKHLIVHDCFEEGEEPGEVQDLRVASVGRGVKFCMRSDSWSREVTSLSRTDNWTLTLPAELNAAAVLISYWTDLSSFYFIAICLAVTVVINLGGTRVYGETEFIFASIKVITIVGLIILGIVLDAGGGPTHEVIGFRNWKAPSGPFQQYLGIEGAWGRFLGFWAVLVQAAFSFQGTEIAAITAGEAIDPRRTLPKSIKRVYLRILLFYILGTFVIGLLVNATDSRLNLSSGTAVSSPFVIAIQDAGIKILPGIVNAAILSSAWSAASSNLGAKAQGISRDVFPYKGPLQPWAAWYALVMCIVIMFLNGFRVFSSSSAFLYSRFITDYLPIIFFPALYLVARCWNGDKQVNLLEMDYFSGSRDPDERPQAPPPQNFAQKFWSWLV